MLKNYCLKGLGHCCGVSDDGKSHNKIYGWAVRKDGKAAITFYGGYGNEVTVGSKASYETSVEEAEKMFAKKVKKGYVQVDFNDDDYNYLTSQFS